MSTGAHTDAARGPANCWAKAPGLCPKGNEQSEKRFYHANPRPTSGECCPEQSCLCPVAGGRGLQLLTC